MMAQMAYMNGVGLVPICREATVAKLSGLTSKERRNVGALIARRNYLMVKLQDMPSSRWGYEGVELSSLDWVLEIVQEYYDLVNLDD